MWPRFVRSPFEVHDMKKCVCNSVYAMLCMDKDYFILSIRKID